MSDNWIVLVPEDPRFIPDETQQQLARERLLQIAPEADEVKITISETVTFFHCGGNFERIRCPSCDSEIDEAWWHDRLSEDHADGFQLAKYSTPCCGSSRTLNELVYEWPQAFGRFSLEAMNPNLGELEAKHRQEFETILGTKLKVIYQHI